MYTHLHIIWKGKDSLIINEFLRILKIMSQKNYWLPLASEYTKNITKKKLVYS